jgi:predicted nuclease of predicted toxin-antitoxin system
LKKLYKDERILVTRHKDFGELGYRLERKVIGVVLLRFPNKKRRLQWPRLNELISLKSSDLIGAFTVINEDNSEFVP